VVDIASRHFRRRGEVERTKPPHERSERGRFGPVPDREARAVKVASLFKSNTPVFAQGLKAIESISGWSWLFHKMFHVEPRRLVSLRMAVR
jgi:hypothetical protein